MTAELLGSYSKVLADEFSDDDDIVKTLNAWVRQPRAEYEPKIPELGDLVERVKQTRRSRREKEEQAERDARWEAHKAQCERERLERAVGPPDPLDELLHKLLAPAERARPDDDLVRAVVDPAADGETAPPPLVERRLEETGAIKYVLAEVDAGQWLVSVISPAGTETIRAASEQMARSELAAMFAAASEDVIVELTARAGEQEIPA